MSFVRAAAVDDLWRGEMRGVAVGAARVLLVNVDGEVRAYEDRCAHLSFPLSRGRLAGTVLTCAAHEWQYDARTGQGLNPRGVCLRRIPVRVEGGDVLVDVAALDGGAS